METELAALDFWPSAACDRLAAIWLTTAEQVLAAAATDGGLSALAEQTGLPERTLRELLGRTRDLLPAAERERLSRPADTSRYGIGALPPGAPRE